MRKLTKENMQDIVKKKEEKMQCNCDLDKWSPEPETGHSWVCRIHMAAMTEWNNSKRRS